MMQPFEAHLPAERPLKVHLRVEQVLSFVLFAFIFGIRVSNVQYNTLFVDEAIYVNLGQHALAPLVDQNALTWMYGSYLYPLLSSSINAVAGETGIRTCSALLSVIAAVCVYRVTERLFHVEAALWALLLFGVSAVSIDLGQFAVYDVLALPFLAGALFCVVRASESGPRAEQLYLVSAAACFTLATLAKYISGLYMPALFCVAVACYLQQERRIWPLVTRFLLPALVVLGLYIWMNQQSLRILIAGRYGIASSQPLEILHTIWNEIGVITLLALGSVGVLVHRAMASASSAHPWRIVVWSFVVPLLLITLFAAPLYHLVTLNLHAAWKHTAYTLLFITPLAGYLCSSFVARLRLESGRYALAIRVASAALSIALVLFGLNQSLDRNWGFQHSWPNASGAVTYLRAERLDPQQRVLAEGAQIYAYYLPTDGQPEVMNDTWYFSYAGREGVDAIRAAVSDYWFDYVIFDGYYTPMVGDQLAPTLVTAGYHLGYEETQFLSTGEQIYIRVYVAPKRNDR